MEIVGFDEQVNDYARHAHVQPDWEGIPNRTFVPGNLSTQGEIHGPQHKPNDHNRQHNVRNQQKIIDWPDPALTAKRRRFVRKVIKNVCYQKNRPKPERRQHGTLVSQYVLSPDKIQTHQQQHRRNGIDNAVNVGQIGRPATQIDLLPDAQHYGNSKRNGYRQNIDNPADLSLLNRL